MRVNPEARLGLLRQTAAKFRAYVGRVRTTWLSVSLTLSYNASRGSLVMSWLPGVAAIIPCFRSGIMCPACPNLRSWNHSNVWPSAFEEAVYS